MSAKILDIDDVLKTKAEEAETPAFSDDALALRFATDHADDLRYTAEWNHWHQWNGAYWSRDRDLAAFDLARKCCREAAGEANKGQKAIASAKTVAAVTSLARADRRIAATVEQWDSDPWLLGTPAGTVDLRTGMVRPNSAADYITRATAAAPGDDCRTWLGAVSKIFDGDQQMVDFVQRVFGYALTGLTREEKLFFLIGEGGNGKGTLVETIASTLGGYSTTVAMSTLMVTKHQEHPTEIAKLRGARLALASETNEGARWNTARIKMLTGGDKLTGRFMRGDFFDFDPTHKLAVSSNRQPMLGDVDNAIKRRLVMVPFNVTFDEPDTTLKERLRAERGAILAWLIQGCLTWQRWGLVLPASVKAATEQYLHDMDTMQMFLDDCCALDFTAQTSSTTLYDAWNAWCERSGEYPGSRKAFTARLKKRFQTREVHHLAHFIGVRLAGDLDDGPPF